MHRFFAYVERHRPRWCAVTSGLLMGSAFLHPWLWWAGVLGFAMYLVGLGLVPARSAAWRYGALSGTVKALVAGSWVWYVYPLDWMGDFGTVAQLFGIGWVWITGCVAVGLGLGVTAHMLYPYLESGWRYLYVPLCLVVGEVLGSVLFSIVQYGPGGSVNVHTSFGYLGYTLAGHGLFGYVALVGGVYALSCTVALLAVGAVELWVRVRAGFMVGNGAGWWAALIVTCTLGSSVIVLPLQPEHLGVRVATVNTMFDNHLSLSPGERADQVRLMIEAFRSALRTESDIVVFPETANALAVFGSPENVFRFIRSQTTRDVVVMDSNERKTEAGNSEVRAVFYDTKTGVVHETYKQFLVPSGEFVPYHLSFMMSLFGFRETERALGERLEFVPGEERAVSTDAAVLPGVLFCSESVSPIEARRVAALATLPLIVHPVSHAWLNEPHTFWYQLHAITRTQVRFAGVPLVQVANMWAPRAYDRYGRPVAGEVVMKTASTSVVVFGM